MTDILPSKEPLDGDLGLKFSIAVVVLTRYPSCIPFSQVCASSVVFEISRPIVNHPRRLDPSSPNRCKRRRPRVKDSMSSSISSSVARESNETD